MTSVAAIPPRRLAALVLALACLLLALFRPVAAPPGVPPPDPAPDVQLLSEGSAWVDHARLSDPAALVTPPVRIGSGLAEGQMAEVSPFSPITPDLRSSPGANLRLPLSGEATDGFKDPAWGDEWAYPLETLGARPPRALPIPRPASVRAFSLDGRFSLERTVGEDLFKTLTISDLKNTSPLVLTLGIDAFGLQASPVLLSGSGNPGLDKAVLGWASRQPWASWLPPGAYRVEIAP